MDNSHSPQSLTSIVKAIAQTAKDNIAPSTCIGETRSEGYRREGKGRELGAFPVRCTSFIIYSECEDFSLGGNLAG